MIYINLNRTDAENWSAAVIRLDTDEMFTINNRVQQAASVTKLFVAGCVMENYDSLCRKYRLSTIDNNLYYMITVSDNNAWSYLVSCLGNGSWYTGCNVLTNWNKKHGCTETSSLGGSGQNYTSARDSAQIVANFYHGKLAGSDKIIGLMKQQTRLWKLPAGLHSGVVSGNKTGELNDTENNVIIVWVDTPYVLSVLTTGVSYSGHAYQMMAGISSLAYDTFK